MIILNYELFNMIISLSIRLSNNDVVDEWLSLMMLVLASWIIIVVAHVYASVTTVANDDNNKNVEDEIYHFIYHNINFNSICYR